MPNITQINNLRINLSSFSKIYKLDKYINFDKCIKFNNNNYKINNDKIININNFDLILKNKHIKYSTFYTNPHFLSVESIKNIKFDQTKNKIIKYLCDKIFLCSKNINKYDEQNINQIITKKNKYINNGFIGFEHTLLILWYIIYSDKYINSIIKQKYFNLIRYFYLKFIFNIFDFNEIVKNTLNINNIIYKKFFISLYILCEEFHFKYINKYLKDNYYCKIIFNSNYIKINPQTLLNDSMGKFYHNIDSITEDISNPFGHNILFIKSNEKVYYYDPDEQNISDIYKFKILFKYSEIDFFNISNRKPIQTITDDSNCVFYCMGLIKYIFENNISIELNKLKNIVLIYESILLSSQTNIFNWTVKYI